MYFSVPCVLVNKGFRANITFVNNSKRKNLKTKNYLERKENGIFQYMYLVTVKNLVQLHS